MEYKARKHLPQACDASGACSAQHQVEISMDFSARKRVRKVQEQIQWIRDRCHAELKGVLQ